MSDKDKTLHQILTASQTGTIVCRLSEILNIPKYDAFRRFFLSKTYAAFRTPGSIMSMLSDQAVIHEFLQSEQI